MIDAVLGRECGKPRSPAVHDRIRLVVLNQNPFRYEYQVNITPHLIVETAPSVFFQLLIPDLATLIPKGQIPTTIPKATARRGAPVAPITCNQSSFQQAADNLLLDYSELTTPSHHDQASLATGLDAARVRVEGFGTLFAGLQKLWTDPRARTDSVVRSALKGTSAADTFVAHDSPLADSIGREVTTFVKHAESFAKEAAYLWHAAQETAECPAARPFVDQAAAFGEDTLNLVAAQQAYAASVIAAKSVDNTMTAILADPTHFQTIQYLGPHESATVDSVIVGRRPITIPSDAGIVSNAAKSAPTAAKPQAVAPTPGTSTSPTADAPPFLPLAVAAVRFGPPRILSIGVAFAAAPMPVRSFSVVRRYRASASPSDSVTTLIAVDQNDNFRFAPMLTMNAQLGNPHLADYFTGWGIVVGATVNKNDQTNLEYFVGPYLNFLDNRLFLAGGMYAGREKFLATGDSLGSQLPVTQTTVPTITRMARRLGAQLGFRIY